MKTTITLEEAGDIAVAGLKHLAEDEDRLGRFCALTGISPGDIRQTAEETGFLAGILEFYLGHEPDLMEFAVRSEIPPERIAIAWRLLGGGEWT